MLFRSGATLHIAIRHRVPIYWCGSRQTACAFTDGFLRTFVRDIVGAGAVTSSATPTITPIVGGAR